MPGDGLANRRILAVEDEVMIAVLIEDVLKILGCVVLGPVSKLEAAVRIAKEEQFDAAILDITIRRGQVFPVAEILMERHIPFVFASGYSDWALPETFRGQPRLEGHNALLLYDQFGEQVRQVRKGDAIVEIDLIGGALGHVRVGGALGFLHDGDPPVPLDFVKSSRPVV